MLEQGTEEIKVDSPRKPLEPVGDGVSEEQRGIYAKLLAEYERIDGINGDKILDRCRLYFRSSEERDDREDDSQGMNAWAHLVKKKLSVPELRCGFKGVLI